MPKLVNFHEDEEVVEPSVVGFDELQNQRAQLPMFQGRKEVVKTILGHAVTIIVGETGSGKSTQLPQALLELGPKQNIVVSQPRRVAAVSLATRVSAEAGSRLGHRVGYNVRFDSKVGAQTRIRYVTDGMLLREFMLDPLLSKYTTVIVDEAHERTVTSDLCLGLLKRLLTHRSPKNFRIIVMSATLDAKRFADFFGPDSAKLYVPGRAFKVDRFFTKQPVPSLIDAAVQTVLQINRGEPADGDILVFLPGQDEIETAVEVLRAAKPERGVPKLAVLPLYASLPEADQQLAFLPASKNHRKVILSTNIAETSVTIPGVTYVVDSGIRKVRVHRAVLGLESLLPASISQASAMQRMGRAGRERNGKCWRLYTEDFYLKEMPPQTEPEISRVSLSLPVLLLKQIGIEDVINFMWVDPPSAPAVRAALLQLYTLKAIDDNHHITPFGLKMATLPLDPPLSAVLVSALTEASPKTCRATIDVAACLSVPDLLQTPPAARREEIAERRQELFPVAQQFGDLVLVKQIWDSYRQVAKESSKSEVKEWCNSIGVSLRALKKVDQVRKQLVEYLKPGKHQKYNNVSDDDDEGEETEQDYEALIKTFLRGYISNTAIALPDRRYQTVMTQQAVSIHPGSAMFGSKPEAIMYLEYVYTARGYARYVSPVEIEWLRELAPHLLARRT